eukprot:6196861-Pleurochrysis_carterae.AAC.2
MASPQIVLLKKSLLGDAASGSELSYGDDILQVRAFTGSVDSSCGSCSLKADGLAPHAAMLAS